MLDPDELDHLKFPVVVNIMEKLEGDVSDADLYNAGWNMTTIRIDSLQDVPKGYGICSVHDDEDPDEWE